MNIYGYFNSLTNHVTACLHDKNVYVHKLSKHAKIIIITESNLVTDFGTMPMPITCCDSPTWTQLESLMDLSHEIYFIGN